MEGASVTRRLSSNQKRANPPYEYPGSFRTCQECVVRRAQFWLTNDVEGPLQHHLLVAQSSRSCEFQITQPEGHATFSRYASDEICKMGTGRSQSDLITYRHTRGKKTRRHQLV